MVSASYDKTVRLWNPYANKLIKVYRGHGYQVVDVAVYVFFCLSKHTVT